METTVKRHPIRGFFYGIFFGLGLALVVVGQGLAALGTWPPFIVLGVGIVAGTLWATYGPAKAPKGPPPTGASLDEEVTPAEKASPAVVGAGEASTTAEEAEQADPRPSEDPDS